MLRLNDPILFCFCGPTGSGKSTICRELLALDSDLSLSISTTTRAPRNKELEGRDYFFVSRDEFETRVQHNCFVEHAEVAGNRYGTEKKNFNECRINGKDLLLDIDYQGAAAFKKAHPTETVVIFVFPPSFSELKNRVAKRGDGESAAHQASRLELASKEVAALTTKGFSDYLLVNDELATAIGEARALIMAERRKIVRIPSETLANLTEPAK